MLKLLLLVTLIGVGSCEKSTLEVLWLSIWGGNGEEDGPPAFCNGLDCPVYVVREKTDDYELRSYTGTSHWVSTSAFTVDYEKSKKRDMFMKLFWYISGNNADDKKIAMTVPVTTKVIPGHGPACESNFTMSFFLADPDVTPRPDDETVFLDTMAPTDFFVRSFSGYADMEDYTDEAAKLTEALEEAGHRYEQGVFYTAGYDAPYKFWNRHNEIWLKAL